jgi:hypothetical protein
MSTYTVIKTESGTCRIGRSGTKSHPAIRRTLLWAETGTTTVEMSPMCSCASYRAGGPSWHGFVITTKDATCNGR